MTVGAIIQARMSSRRLPGKAMAELPFGSGIPAISQVIRRVAAADSIGKVVLATSEEPEDRVLLEVAEREGIIGFAGSLEDVLDRFHQAATRHRFDHVARFTGDCPCLDPALIDRVVSHHLDQEADLTSCSIVRTFPVGFDTAVIRKEALTQAWSEARRSEDREHVTSYLYRTAPDRFTIRVYEAGGAQRRPDLRVTLDTPRDYALLGIVFDALHVEDPLFGLDRLIALFDAEPWLGRINTGTDREGPLTEESEGIEELLAYCRGRGLDQVPALLGIGRERS